MNKPAVYKQNGIKQRSNTELTKEIAITLREMIISGKKIPTTYPDYLDIKTESGEVKRIMSYNVNKWVSYENVIPELNVTLRSYLDGARQERKVMVRQQREEQLLADVEREFRRTMNLRTNVPVVSWGKVVKREDGSIMRKESDKLLAIKMTTAQYLAERLDKQKYGKIERTQNEHLVGFSLSDLRKADKILKEQENGQQQ